MLIKSGNGERGKENGERRTGKGERGKENGERRTEKRKPKTRKMERESRTESTAVIRMKPLKMTDDDTEKVSSTQVLFELSRPRNYHER